MMDWDKLDEREKLVWAAAFGAHYAGNKLGDGAEWRADSAVVTLRKRQQEHDEKKKERAGK